MTTMPPASEKTSGYADVNGVNLYYEIHGEGQPLLLLHGAYMVIEAWNNYLSLLATRYKVIAVELQGHGRTVDIDRPIRYETMADDVAAFISHMGLESVDIFGYSMGAGVALQVALRHPEVVGKLVLASVSFNSDGVHPGILDGIDQITPEVFVGTPMEQAYMSTSPHPEKWADFIEKMKDLDAQPQDWSPDAIHALTMPAFLVLGDSDIIRPEHIVELFRLFGGGVAGDMVGLPASRLAILPGTTHVTVMDRADWLVPMIEEFLKQ